MGAAVRNSGGRPSAVGNGPRTSYASTASGVSSRWAVVMVVQTAPGARTHRPAALRAVTFPSGSRRRRVAPAVTPRPAARPGGGGAVTPPPAGGPGAGGGPRPLPPPAPGGPGGG